MDGMGDRDACGCDEGKDAREQLHCAIVTSGMAARKREEKTIYSCNFHSSLPASLYLTWPILVARKEVEVAPAIAAFEPKRRERMCSSRLCDRDTNDVAGVLSIAFKTRDEPNILLSRQRQP